jgi:hypothetical protein
MQVPMKGGLRNIARNERVCWTKVGRWAKAVWQRARRE